MQDKDKTKGQLISELTGMRQRIAQLEKSAARFKRSENVLREREERFREFFKNAPEFCYIISPDLTILDINRYALKALGYKKRELVGRSVKVICSPESLSKMESLFTEWERTGKFGDAETMTLKKNGEMRTVISSARSIRGKSGKIPYFIFVQKDITKRKQTEETLQKEKDRAKKYLDISGVIIVAINEKGEVTLINKKGCEVLGYKEDEIIGKNWLKNFIPKRIREDVNVVSQKLLAGKKDQAEYFENPVLAKSGEERIIAWRNVELKDEAGKIVGHLSSGEDITERKQLEDNLNLSLREKEVLLKEIHHRVKNNMQIIYSLFNLQSRYTKDKNALSMLKETQDRVRSMALIHEKFYQTEDLSKINFADYLRNLVSGLFHSYEVNFGDIELVLNIDSVFLGVNAAIPCGLIINELVSNSLKHAFPEGRRGKIFIDFRPYQKAKFILTFRDNGVGFPQEIDFRNTESLGMQLVTTLVEQLDGSIKLDRRKGTSFKIIFKK